MLIAHCADIHLDSALSGVKDSKQRRLELLQSFEQMLARCSQSGVSAILIAGDLFDSDQTTASTIRTVIHLLDKYSSMQFFVVRGNHGGNKAYNAVESANLNNVHFFEKGKWDYYKIGNVVIAGTELDGVRDYEVWQTLNLSSDNYNILLLHGDTEDSKYGLLDGKTLTNSRANYIALGHRHSHSITKLSPKTVAVYSGVLEARGFDERQTSGFVLLDTDSGKISHIPQHIRSVVTQTVAVDGLDNALAILTAVEYSTQSIPTANYLNLVLTGKRATTLPIEQLYQRLQQSFFAVRIQDDTIPDVDYNKLSQELSLRGKVVATAMAQISDQHTRNEVIRLALCALSGEELS